MFKSRAELKDCVAFEDPQVLEKLAWDLTLELIHLRHRLYFMGLMDSILISKE